MKRTILLLTMVGALLLASASAVLAQQTTLDKDFVKKESAPSKKGLAAPESRDPAPTIVNGQPADQGEYPAQGFLEIEFKPDFPGVYTRIGAEPLNTWVHDRIDNEPPVAEDDSYTTQEDQTLTVDAPGVLTNDTDVEDDPLTAVLVEGPSNGELALDDDGSFTYTPEPRFDGQDFEDSFTYKASDGTDESNEATVTITVESACTIIGTEGNDFLQGTSGEDVFCGLEGDDVLVGLDSDDTLAGAEGNDILFGVSGGDTLLGAEGDDMLLVRDGVSGNDTVDGEEGNDFCLADQGDSLTSCERGSPSSLSAQERQRLDAAVKEAAKR